MPNLVLTRKVDERIVIHVDGVVIATVAVVDLTSGRVKLGCEADDTISIDRQEVYDTKYTTTPSTETQG